MDMHEVVSKLIGDVIPIGSSEEDHIRFENLKIMTYLVDRLVGDIDRVAGGKDRHEFSISRAGKYANKFLDDLGIVK